MAVTAGGRSDPTVRTPDQDESVERPAKLLRITSMIRELLQEARQSTLDEPGRARLRDIHARTLGELSEILSDDLRRELDTLAVPLEGTSSDSEIRMAQAQLVGWLEGLIHGIQAALMIQQMEARGVPGGLGPRQLSAGVREADGTAEHPGGPGQYL